MFREPPFRKPHRHPNSLVLTVSLRGAPCRRLRRAFFARMHQEARRLGVVMAQKLGLCVIYSAERICTSAHRHQIVNWLMDQPEVASISVGSLHHLGDLFSSKLRVWSDVPLSAEARIAAQMQVYRAAAGVTKQWVGYLTGRVA